MNTQVNVVEFSNEEKEKYVITFDRWRYEMSDHHTEHWISVEQYQTTERQ